MIAETPAPPFQYLRGHHLLVPFIPGQPDLPEETLVQVFKRLKDESLDLLCFHEHEMTLSAFLAFMTAPNVRLCLFCLSENDRVRDLCGLAWLCDIENLQSRLTRAIGNFCFYKDYWHPAHTDVFGKMFFEFVFDVLGINTLVGQTPAGNDLARRYIKRVGMREVGIIPNYTLYNGEISDAVITQLTKEEFTERTG